jgi:dienelactone hydrolase
MNETFDFTYGEAAFPMSGEIAKPSGGGPHPAVLVMHSALGLDELVCRRARDLAALGYVALATDVYGIGRGTLSKQESGKVFLALQQDPKLLRMRVGAGFEALRALPEVNSARIAAIGFCFGGQCVLELARTGVDVRSVVSFHGLLRTPIPAQPGVVKAKLLTISGAKDPYVPTEDVVAFQDEMTKAGADWQVTIYGQGLHAFTEPNVQQLDVPGTAYDPFLDRLSWAQATEFLAATLEV